MKPVEFKEQTNVLRAPDCNDLPVFSNGEVVISKWVPTDEEIELIKQGEGIYLLVQSGLTSPPVNLFVGNPFVHESSENT